MLSLICAWTKSWANNGDTCDLRRHRAHYDVIVMELTLKLIRWGIITSHRKYGDVIDLLHNSHNAPVPYPTMHFFVTEMCTGVHISVTKWCIVGYLYNALWDMWDGFIFFYHFPNKIYQTPLYTCICVCVCICIKFKLHREWVLYFMGLIWNPMLSGFM